MRLHSPGQWFFFSPEKLYFSSCDSVLLGCDMFIILSNDYLMPLPVGQVIVLKKTELNTHYSCCVATGSVTGYLSE
jgi:hypothetical protein